MPRRASLVFPARFGVVVSNLLLKVSKVSEGEGLELSIPRVDPPGLIQRFLGPGGICGDRPSAFVSETFEV